MLPVLVAAMAFLAALALAGAAGSSALVRHWREGAAAAVTVQVPDPAKPLPAEGDAPERTRLDRALDLLRATPGVAQARAVGEAELKALLRPWLGDADPGVALPLPAVVQVHLESGGADLDAVQARLTAAVPGTLVESHGVWVQRLATLAQSLQACAWLALAVVGGVAASVVMVGVRTGLLARRDAIEIVHGLGATDGYIASRFAARATLLAGIGGLCGAVLALPVLLALARLAAPFVSGAAEAGHLPHAAAEWAGLLRTLPRELLIGLPLLPLAAALIGLLTAQATVRAWLRRLP